VYYALLYDYVDDYVEKRALVREEHLSLTGAAKERGELLLGGAFADGPAGALLVWKVDDRSVIEAFVDVDPYVRTGVVTGWRIREWTVVVGND
jgi:uncharacterized protein YciI